MNVIETTFVLLILATSIVALTPRVRLPIEVLLLLGSLVLSFIPGLPPITMQPEIVFLLFLPPILFAAAYFTSWRDFKANKGPIALLAIGLVVFTTLAVAAVAKALIPGLPWPAAFILGAMVSPPDASAATALIRKLGVPRRLVTIIEGESLINDATALVSYKFAVAALVTGAFSLKMAVVQFVWVGIGGVFSGLFVGWTGIWMLAHIQDTTPRTLLTFLAAFAAYVLGESLGVSGVISTVVAGLYFGRWIPAHGTAEGRINAQASWELMLFVVNAFVFTLIGFQLPAVLHALKGYSKTELIVSAVAVSGTVILVRFIWMFSSAAVERRLFVSLHKKVSAPGWPALAVLSWTAMRGIVTLAAALSLPLLLPTGDPFPYRPLLIFLSYAVILVTLLLPALSLPKLLSWLGLKAGEERYREELQARIHMTRAALDALKQIPRKPGDFVRPLESLEKRYSRRLDILNANLSDSAFSPLYDEDTRERKLLRDILGQERDALVTLREQGVMHDEVFHQIVRELDLEDLRLRTQRL